MKIRRPTDPAPARAPSPRGWAVAGAIIGLTLALVFFAPASWLAGVLHQASTGQVQLAQVRGTIWNGSGQLLVTGGAGSRDQASLPGRLYWTVRPHGLYLAITLNADCCTTEPLALTLAPHWGGASVSIDNNHSQWPTAVLAGLGTPWNTMRIEGSLNLRTQDLGFNWTAGRLAVTGSAQVQALDLSSRLSTLKPMGSYQLSLNGGANPTLDLTTLSGSLQLSGNGTWVGSRLRFKGQASAAPEHEAALANLLNIIGRRDGARSLISVG